MSFVSCSLPPEADDPPPAVPTELESLAAERRRLLDQVRPRIRTRRQVRIQGQIAQITRAMLEKQGA